MITTPFDTRLATGELDAILADLRRPGIGVDEILALGTRLSRIAGEIASACERAFLIAMDGVAA